YHGENPAWGVRLPEMKRRELHALNFEQARQVLARLPNPAKEMALLSMTASLNVGEMLALRWKRVNLTSDPTVSEGELLPPYSLAVRENYYDGVFGSVKASTRRRIVPLPPMVVETLAAHRASSLHPNPDDIVFCSRNGKPKNERNLLRRALKPAGEALGMPWLSWHVFRRTHATFGEQIGMALSDRQAQMGHSGPRMTLHYTQSDLSRRRGSVDAIAERLRQGNAA
ncbi:MAG: tyrosine-type recombinase/integrase, partial [Acidobacteria bacterium]|nr:tyrosine-type recombinase/integrase [Acidobacteriota bacterium]